MATSPLIIVLLQAAGAVLFGVGLRACGTHRRRPARSGLWIAPVLWALAESSPSRLRPRCGSPP